MKKVTLNYVWINAVPHNNGIVATACSDPLSATCPIPKRYIDNVRRVREEHPDIFVNIWMDAYRRNDRKGDLSRAFAHSAGLDGVSFRGLREIPNYRKNPLFALGDNKLDKSVVGIIWRQVDLARLLVLKHQMEKIGGIQTYVDFDILDPPTREHEVKKISAHGFLIEACFDVKPHEVDPEQCEYENRLMAFCEGSTAAESFLNAAIVNTEKAYREDIKSSPNGWEPFCEAFRTAKRVFLPDVSLLELTVTRNAQRTDHSDYPGFKV